ncbi:hypothetical protein Sjap_003124 [Stephania japonica]|uniref:Uncharacterized protein n=1 Tax=Stephania japonica TaxID=461633 RepID=A0AAP0KPW7_9MAGN
MRARERRLWKMKSGGVSSYVLPVKRGERGLALVVLGIVILSMLIPFVFLLGLHNSFHSTNETGYRKVCFGVYKRVAYRSPQYATCHVPIGKTASHTAVHPITVRHVAQFHQP